MNSEIPRKPTLRERLAASKARLQRQNGGATASESGKPGTGPETVPNAANAVLGDLPPGPALDAMKIHAALDRAGGYKGPVKQRITYACGHEDSNRACPACQQRRRRAWQDKQRGKGLKKAEQACTGRLPDGSVFNAEYDAHDQQWHGKLIIEHNPEPGDPDRADELKIFEGIASSVFKLLTALDGHYRAWLEAQQPPKP